jgi:hypothetical protein
MSVVEFPMHSAAPALPQGLPREQRVRARHLRITAIARRRRRVRVAVWATALLTALALFVLVAFHVLAVQHAFEIDQLARQQAREALRYERLRAEVATLSSSESVVQAARDLGMIPASKVEYLDAPAAAPRADTSDRTTSTLVDAHAAAKRSVDP